MRPVVLRFSLSGRRAEALHPVVQNASGPLCRQHLEAYFHLKYAAIRELPYVSTHNARENKWRWGKTAALIGGINKQTACFWKFGEGLERREMFTQEWKTEQKRKT